MKKWNCSTFFLGYLQFTKKNSGRKNFCSIFCHKILTDLKTNFTKFELSTTFRSWGITDYIPIKKSFFPLEILPGLPIRNKILKIDFMFLILHKYFAAELL